MEKEEFKVASMKELLSSQEGRDVFSKMLLSYFFTLRVRDGNEFPMIGYAEKLRSSIKNAIRIETTFDIQNLENFPRADRDWKIYAKKLAEEGKSFVLHKEEIPGGVLDGIFMLLANVQDALENRGSDDYNNEYLSKIPIELHNMMHRVIQLGAVVMLVFYEMRRGQENLEYLKLRDFKVMQSSNFDFQFVKKMRSESDKNHNVKGTNIACSGVIPFVDYELADGKTIFNPGRFFVSYLDSVPEAPTIAKGKGGYLFQRVIPVSKRFSYHHPDVKKFFYPNMKGEKLLETAQNCPKLYLYLSAGRETLAHALGDLCVMIGADRCTNHQLR